MDRLKKHSHIPGIFLIDEVVTSHLFELALTREFPKVPLDHG